MPRVLNGALAVFLLAFLTPLVSTFGDHGLVIQVFLVFVVVLVLLVAVPCAASALRPGSVGRAARRLRARRRSG